MAWKKNRQTETEYGRRYDRKTANTIKRLGIYPLSLSDESALYLSI